MDGLLHHCLREIAFDGDLGCDVSRLEEFIKGFHEEHETEAQVVDDAYIAFVWSLIAGEESVIIGLTEYGTPPVWIAPQPSAVRKQKKARLEGATADNPSTLEALPFAESQKSLSELLTQHGGSLRIAVNHETSFKAITGSHVRPPTLGGMAYTALQLISRSRASGMPMKALGDATGYDQKTIHYLASQLVDLNLILKIRTTGQSKHSCIHRYFYPESIFYVPPPPREAGLAASNTYPSTPKSRSEDVLTEPQTDSTSLFAEEPLDPKFLTVDSLIRSRLLALLKHSPNNLHRTENLLLAIGCDSAERAHKRHLHHRLQVYEREGWLEKVYAAHSTVPGSRALCVRLTSNQDPSTATPAIPVGTQIPSPSSSVRPSALLSVQHQIILLIAKSGVNGMTLNDISEQLGNFDRRTLEHMLSRFERSPPPPHLSRLAIVQMLETVKREHRHKYYTAAHLNSVVADIGNAPAVQVPLVEHGSTFSNFAPQSHYTSRGQLVEVLERIKDGQKSITSRSAKPRSNPIGADGKVIRGRPRKEWNLQAGKKKTRPTSGHEVPSANAGHSDGKVTQSHKRKRSDVDGAHDQDVDENVVLDQNSCNEELQSASIDLNRPFVIPDDLGEDIDRSEEVSNISPPRMSIDLTPNNDLASIIAAGVQDPEGVPQPQAIPSNLVEPSRKPRGMAVNITYMRREKEVLHLLNEHGGIAVADQGFRRQHMALLEDWSNKSLPVSAPVGTLCDKRTFSTLLDTMADRDLVKVQKTTIPDRNSIRRPITLFHTPNITTDQLTAFMQNLAHKPLDRAQAQIATYAVIQDRYGEVTHPDGSLLTGNRSSTSDLSTRTPQEVRSELLCDSQTSAQLFGFIVGRIARARELHLYLLSQLTGDSSDELFCPRSDGFIPARCLWTDIPLSVYCSLVSITAYSHELEDMLRDGAKRLCPIKDLPLSFQERLSVGRSRSRFKMMELLDILNHLELIKLTHTLPFRSSTDPVLPYDALLSDQHMHNTTGWKMMLIAPIYGFARSDESAPCLGYMPVATTEEAIEYWECARTASLVDSFRLEDDPVDLEGASRFPGPASRIKPLKRQAAWSAEFHLSSRQTDYIAICLANIIQNGDITEELLDTICYAAVAPRDVVLRCLHVLQATPAAVSSRKARTRKKRPIVTDYDLVIQRHEEETARALQLEQSKQQLKYSWDRLVLEVQEDPLSTTQMTDPGFIRLRKSFDASEGNIDVGKLKKALRKVLETSLSTAAPPTIDRAPDALIPRTSPSPTLRLPQVESDSISRFVENLISKQTPRTAETNKEKRARRAFAPGPPSKRGQRFVWTADYDELAQDATVILAARGRASKLMSWVPMSQIFPAVDTNGVRTRITRLREDPAKETYMMNLEQAWYSLWQESRKSGVLVDLHPESPSKVDLVAHIIFLRRNLDKGRIRSVGTMPAAQPYQCKLPANVTCIATHFKESATQPEPTWDFLWNVPGDEARERQAHHEPFTLRDVLPLGVKLSGSVAVAATAIKMTLASPEADYDSQAAQRMLQGCGEENITTAFAHLESQDVVTRVLSDPQKQAPGRQWRFQEWQEETLMGPIPPKVWTAAQTFEDDLETDHLTEIPYVVADGSMATLAYMVSTGKVSLVVDTTTPAKRRYEVDGNSKRVVDDQLETCVTAVLSTSQRQRRKSSPRPISADLRFVPAAQSAAVIGHQDSEIDRVLKLALGVGCQGLLHDDLPPNSMSFSAVRHLSAGHEPVLFWSLADKEMPRLIHSAFKDHWGVNISGEDLTKKVIFPRRWLDVQGRDILRIRSNCLRIVVGWTFNRPRISLLELRRRLQRVLGADEVADLIQYLDDTGILDLHWHSNIVQPDKGTRDLMSLTETESSRVMLSTKGNGKGWYRC